MEMIVGIKEPKLKGHEGHKVFGFSFVTFVSFVFETYPTTRISRGMSLRLSAPFSVMTMLSSTRTPL